MTTPRFMHRLATLSLSATLGITAGAVATALVTPAPAQAASSIGGPIVADEMFSRAQNWVNQGITYTQTGPWASDGAGSTYRRDCSGLVAMAWHLPKLALPWGTVNSPVTDDFQHAHDANHPWTTVAGGINNFQPGDAMVKDGHIELFVKWVNAASHSEGAYVYSFNSQDETVQNPYANSNFGNRGKNSWSDLLTYSPIRYDNVTTAVAAGSQSSGSVVFNGTMYEFARGSDGTIKYWFGNGGPWSADQTVTGSSGITSDPVATVFNGNLYVFARGSDGSLKYFYGNGGPWSSVQTVSGSTGGTGAPTAVTFNGNLYVYSRGSDGTVKYWFGNGGPWSATQTLAGTVIDAPLASTVFNGYLYVLARGTDGSVKYWYANGGAWSAVQTISGSSGISGGLAASVYDGTLYVFGRATDGTVRYWFGNGGPWSSAQTIPASSVSGAVSTSVYDGVLFTFARGTDGTVKYWFGTGGPWSATQTFGSGLA